MRFMSLFFVLALPFSSNAALIGTGDVKDLAAGEEKAAAILRDRCEKVAMLYPSARRACEKAIKDGRITAAAAAYCSARTDYGLEPCLNSVAGRDFSDGVLAACKQTENGKGAPAKEQCLEYFAQTSSQFDSELAKFCFAHTMRQFGSAVRCLNSIRDRELDAAAIKKECSEKPAGSGLIGEGFEDCVERMAAAAPLLRCAGSTGGLKPAAKASSGVR